VNLTLQFLGTGTSQGVPMIACPCKVCSSSDPKDKRLRSSLLISSGTKNFLIDAGPDFRYQMLRAGVKSLDAILLTHEHRDHIAGLDDVRAFNYFQDSPTDLYAEKRVVQEIEHVFAYAFSDQKYPGAPEITLHAIDEKPFSIGEISIHPIRAMHHRLPVLGFRIGSFAYITDANHIESMEMEKLKNLNILVINALRPQPHLSHFCLQEALEVIRLLQPTRAYLTHISHQMGCYRDIQPRLPKGVFLAFDGQIVHCT